MNDFDDVVFFSLGSVLRRSLSILISELPLFLIITTLTFSPVIALSVFINLASSSPEPKEIYIISYLLSLSLQPLATAILIHGVFRRLRGEKARLGDCLRTGLSRLMAVLGFSIVSYIASTLGMMLCIIPGIVISCMMYVGMPVVVVEGKGTIDAIRRSDGLTKGFRWSIFALVVLTGLTSNILSGTLSIVMNMIGVMSESTASLFSMNLAQILTATLSAVLTAVTYHDLRISRDGIDSDDLVSIFD